MLLDTARQTNLLSNLRAGRTCQTQLCNVGLDTQHLCASRCAPNVDHEDFVLGELGDLCLLAVFRLDTQKASQQEVVDLQLAVDAGQFATKAENLANKTIGT